MGVVLETNYAWLHSVVDVCKASGFKTPSPGFKWRLKVILQGVATCWQTSSAFILYLCAEHNNEHFIIISICCSVWAPCSAICSSRCLSVWFPCCNRIFNSAYFPMYLWRNVGVVCIICFLRLLYSSTVSLSSSLVSVASFIFMHHGHIYCKLLTNVPDAEYGKQLNTL